MKLVQLYKQIKEESKILTPLRSKEEREKNFLIATNKKIQEYIKNGSQGDLDLGGTPITSLPNNLTKVGGYLNLEDTKKHPNTPNTTIKANCYLQDTPLAKLPDNLTVGGYLDLEGTKITSLPKDLTVGGYLDLRNTPISDTHTEEEIYQMVPGVKDGRIEFW